ncbi:uncharacterized protein LOC129602421 [Paramacrobiotus metropolitanus]|uniref:uncharacterized protein LOC129602421 n=1 Tax=Paramacrobiotus metropolitanus TaxID=2943436 RepID=UPI00244650D3|nr:uncharacterized protein LOC129602421 [Paramacrobiotus metropolitanus]
MVYVKPRNRLNPPKRRVKKEQLIKKARHAQANEKRKDAFWRNNGASPSYSCASLRSTLPPPAVSGSSGARGKSASLPRKAPAPSGSDVNSHLVSGQREGIGAGTTQPALGVNVVVSTNATAPRQSARLQKDQQNLPAVAARNVGKRPTECSTAPPVQPASPSPRRTERQQDDRQKAAVTVKNLKRPTESSASQLAQSALPSPPALRRSARMQEHQHQDPAAMVKNGKRASAAAGRVENSASSPSARTVVTGKRRPLAQLNENAIEAESAERGKPTRSSPQHPRPLPVAPNRREKSLHDMMVDLANPRRIICTADLFKRQGMKNFRKIGEGSYADVFCATRGKEDIVLKFIPVDGEIVRDVGVEKQITVDDLLSEVLISLKVTEKLLAEKGQFSAPVFVRTHFVKICCGPYPTELAATCDLFREERGPESQNLLPAEYQPTQTFVLIGLAQGGVDLEKFGFSSTSQLWNAVLQMALGLSIAEDALQFEHRDAHLSNVLIKSTDAELTYFKWGEKRYAIPTHGVNLRLIDFTLSRIQDEGRAIFNDLARDPALFTGRSAQSKVYKAMKRATKNCWKKFSPATNILWTKYILSSLLETHAELLESASKEDDLAAKEKLLHLSEVLTTVRSLRDLDDEFFEEMRI